MAPREVIGDDPAEELDQFLAHFARGGPCVHELRALRVPNGAGTMTLAGYFDLSTDRGQAALKRAALELAKLGPASAPEGVYLTLNPLRPELYDRSPDALAEVRTTATDADVIERRWLLIDVDPVRAAKTPATDREKAAAREVIDNVRADLAGRGWAAPLLHDSGNGWHLLYPVNMPVRDGDTVRLLLKSLALKHNTPGAHIDTSVYNPSRIFKIPGTVARKGPPTKDRPHRMARVVEVPAW
jgi:hypothetical protein